MNVKLFNKWGVEGITVADLGIADYITLEPKIVPRTGARYAGNKFHKSKTFIIERLMNKVMIPGHKNKKHFKTSYPMTGKALTAYGLIKQVLTKIESTTKQNPIGVVVRAIENAATREEIVTIEYGGARYPKAVECAPQRRVDIALRWMVQGAYHKSFNSKKSFADALTEEIINASQASQNSNAISRKLELERQADASR